MSGIVISSLLTLAGLSSGSRVAFWVLAWHVAFVVKLVGPGPLLGHDAQGNPIHEGTALHSLAALIGMLLGLLLYSLLSFVVLRRWPQLWPRVNRNS